MDAEPSHQKLIHILASRGPSTSQLSALPGTKTQTRVRYKMESATTGLLAHFYPHLPTPPLYNRWDFGLEELRDGQPLSWALRPVL